MRDGAQVVVEMLERVERRKGNQVAKCGAVASADPGKSQRKTYAKDKSLILWIAASSLPKLFQLRDRRAVSPCICMRTEPTEMKERERM